MAVAAAILLSGATGYWRGVTNTENSIAADIAREEQLAQSVYDMAVAAAASEISKIEIVNKTIRQELEREVRIEQVYTECRHTDGTLRMLNAVLTGERSGESFNRSKLPAFNTAD